MPVSPGGDRPRGVHLFGGTSFSSPRMGARPCRNARASCIRGIPPCARWFALAWWSRLRLHSGSRSLLCRHCLSLNFVDSVRDTRVMAIRPKRPRDTNQLAKFIVDRSVGEVQNNDAAPSVKALTGRLGGL